MCSRGMRPCGGFHAKAAFIDEACEDFECEEDVIADGGDETGETHNAAGGVKVFDNERPIGAGKGEEALEGVTGDGGIGGKVGGKGGNSSKIGENWSMEPVQERMQVCGSVKDAGEGLVEVVLSRGLRSS